MAEGGVGMRIVITGGGGFLGQRVARALLERGGLGTEPGAAGGLTELVLVDQAMPQSSVTDARVRQMTGDIRDAALIDRVFGP